MSTSLVPDYYNLYQLCDKWGFNLTQIQHVITKYNGRLWSKIARKTIVCETKIISIDQEPEAEYEITHDGFVELCKDSSSIDSRKNLNDIFSEGTISIYTLKCDKKGYFRFLDSIHEIGLDDIYIHHEEAYRIETALTINKSTKKKKFLRSDVISISLLKIIFPKLQKEGIKLIADMQFKKLCWERLPAALKEIGCDNIQVDFRGEQDYREFKASHRSMEIPSTNFKAFRERLPGILDYYLNNS